MTQPKIQFRRRLIVVIFLCLAVAGAVIRHYAEPGSRLRDLGTLLLVLWLPLIGNIIGWLMRRWMTPKPAPPAGFDLKPGFTPHAHALITLRRAAVPAANVPLAPGQYRAAIVTGNEGFSARWIVPQGEKMAREVERLVQLEFLAPDKAQARLGPDTVFRVLVQDAFIADGRIVSWTEAAQTV
jgi:hypothetical protein